MNFYFFDTYLYNKVTQKCRIRVMIAWKKKNNNYLDVILASLGLALCKMFCNPYSDFSVKNDSKLQEDN